MRSNGILRSIGGEERKIKRSVGVLSPSLHLAENQEMLDVVMGVWAGWARERAV